MEWYYAVGDKQMGPVGDDEFKRLAAEGTIRPDTLVWRAGMANWTSYREVTAAAAGGEPALVMASATASAAGAAPAAGSVVCRECGRIFPPEDVAKFGDAFVCAACKPVYLQRMREGGAVPGAVEYAGFWLRFLARVIDGIIVGVFMLVVFFSLGLGAGLFQFTPGQPPPMASMQAQLAINGLSLLVAITYNTLFVAKFGATPGKMAVRVRVVTAEGERVSFGRAFGRACADRLSAMICYIGYIIAGFDEQKRSLHDHICSTRVIRN